MWDARCEPTLRRLQVKIWNKRVRPHNTQHTHTERSFSSNSIVQLNDFMTVEKFRFFSCFIQADARHSCMHEEWKVHRNYLSWPTHDIMCQSEWFQQKKKYSSIDCIISCERSFIVCTKFPALYCHVHYVFDRIEFAKLLMITSNNFCWPNQFRSPQFLPLVWIYTVASWINNKCTNGANHFWKYHAVLHLWNTRESRVLHGARSGAGTNQLHSKHPLSTLTIHCIALVCYSGDVTVFFATT